MNAQFAHYWQEDVILNEEEREHQLEIARALNQGFVYTVPEGSPLNGSIRTSLTKSECREMMLREHGVSPDLMPFLRNEDEDDEDDEDDELAQHLRNREPSEIEPAIFITQADYDAAISWVFFQ